VTVKKVLSNVIIDTGFTTVFGYDVT